MTQPTPQPRALIVSGGWEGHHPAATADIFARILRGEGFDVEVSTSLDTLTEPGRLEGLSLVVPNWTMGRISGEQVDALGRAVAAGVGLAGAHGGMGDAFRDNPWFQFMVGGQFVAHPDNHKDYVVNLVKRHDPVVAGLADFPVHSELYYMHTDPGNDVLAVSVWKSASCPWIDNVVMPVAWKRMHGRGRVFYNSLGHEPSIWDIPQAREIQRRGFRWAARLDA